MAERLRDTWPDLVLVVVGTAEEQTKVAAPDHLGRRLSLPASSGVCAARASVRRRRAAPPRSRERRTHARADASRFLAARAAAKSARRRQEPRACCPASSPRWSSSAVAGVWYAMSPAAARGRSRGRHRRAVVSTAGRVAASPNPNRRRPPRQGCRASEAAAPPPAAAPASPRRRRRPPAAADDVGPRPAAPRPRHRPWCRCPRKSRRALRRRRRPRPHTTNSACASNSRRPKAHCSAASSPRRRTATPSTLFRGALELDPGNTLAKAGLVRVADRLLSAAERALTAGSVEDARKMVDVAESLTPATARGAFLMMQIEREDERAALTRAKDGDAQDKLDQGRHLPAARERAPAQRRADRAFRRQRALLPGSGATDHARRSGARRNLARAAEAVARSRGHGRHRPAMRPTPNAGWRMPTAPARSARK